MNCFKHGFHAHHRRPHPIFQEQGDALIGHLLVLGGHTQDDVGQVVAAAQIVVALSAEQHFHHPLRPLGEHHPIHVPAEAHHLKGMDDEVGWHIGMEDIPSIHNEAQRFRVWPPLVPVLRELLVEQPV